MAGVLSTPSAVDGVYGLLLAAGGIVGYARAGSVPSLVAGVASGAVVSLAASRWVKSLYSAVLAVVMGRRWLGGGKFMPAGLVAVLGAAMCLYNAARKSTKPAPPPPIDGSDTTVFAACGHPGDPEERPPTIHVLRLSKDGTALSAASSVELPSGSAMPMFQAVGDGFVHSVAGDKGIVTYKHKAETSELELWGAQTTAVVTEDEQVEGVSPGGAGACHITLSRCGRHIFCANCKMVMLSRFVALPVSLTKSITVADEHGSVAVLPVGTDGRVGSPKVTVHGKGAHHGLDVDPSAWGSSYKARQTKAHPHGVHPSPDGRHLLVADLGMNAIVVYAFDSGSGDLTPVGQTALHEGAGPRHLDFTPDGSRVFVVNELDNTVTDMKFDPSTGPSDSNR